MAQIPYQEQFLLGRGLNLAGLNPEQPYSKALDFDEPPADEGGQKTIAEFTEIRSTEELMEALSINVSASVTKGLGGMSGELKFSQSREVSRYYLYALVKVIVTNPSRIIRNPRLTAEARQLLDRNDGLDAFVRSYGWEYIEGLISLPDTFSKSF